MAPTLKLVDRDGQLVPFTVRTERTWRPSPSPRMNRIAYSAAHVVADPRSSADPWLTAALDWEATLAYRERLFSLGLGVAEAMDTAQRGMGLDWPTSLELIRRSVAQAKGHLGARIACGAGCCVFT